MVMPMSVDLRPKIGAAVLLLLAAGLAWHGQPAPEEKWQFIAAELEPRLTERQVQIDPAEMLELMYNDYIDLRLIDVRNERDWNLFHLRGAQHIPLDGLLEYRQRFAKLPENGVIVFVSNDERDATEAWKLVMANAQRPNAYILAGGLNRWLGEYAQPRSGAKSVEQAGEEETLRYPMTWALGARHPASLPDQHAVQTHEFTKRVKLQKRVVKKGGCG